ARDSEVTGKVRARVRLANGSLYSEKGVIDFLDIQVNPRTDGQIVRAMFPNPDDILTSGQTVRVIIEEKGGDKVLVIPETAIAIAGVIALRALPVAQFPDIVPPQVGVTATYPGASAAAVEESVAQVIEAQVNGVDKMIYMKSTSGGDGSYSLNVTFQVGSDPDINTVNVTNRVNQALALLPPEV